MTMNTTNNSHKGIAVAFSVLLMLLLTFSAASAKDARARKQSVPSSSVSAAGGSERGIIIVSGKGGKDAATKVNARKVQQGVKVNPGGPVELNPQPLPPKAFKRKIKTNPVDAVGLNPQPLPPK
jgi:hypothetical protein